MPVLGIDVEQLRDTDSQPQALLYHGGRHEEGGGDLLARPGPFTQCDEGAELVEGMQRLALNILGELSTSAMPPGRALRRGSARF